jgi:excisionase family DNA binding protein
MAGSASRPTVPTGERSHPDWRARGQAEVLSIRDVAAYLDLPLSTVYRLVGRAELPGLKMGRQWRFHKAALDEWLRRVPGRPGEGVG